MSLKAVEEKDDKKDKPLGSQSLFRGLQLIEILSNFPNGCPLAHLSELAGMNKSTVHRLLQGLHTSGYVTQAPSPGSYRLTTKFNFGRPESAFFAEYYPRCRTTSGAAQS
jgi:IclR family transcriptional regulator, carbohydrate utilization repressor